MSGFEILGATIKLIKSVADQIQDGPDQIQQKIGRLESLASLAKQIQNTKSLQIEDIAKILARCECHVQSLQDLLQKISFNRRNSIRKKTWRAISGLKQEANILKLFDDLDHEYNSLNTHIHLRIFTIAEDIQTGYNSIDTTFNTTANSSPDSLKCQQALFITDPAIDRAKLINSKGELKKEFVEWKNSDGGLLWISGGPGFEYLSVCFLSSGDARTHYSTFFFCDAKDNTRNNAVAIIRGILFQLVEQKKELIRHILPRYEVQKEQLFSQTSFETVWKFFLEMTNDLGHSQATRTIDGLDECEPISLELLLKNLKKITSTSPRLKIIVLSREYPQIIGALLDAKTEVNRGLEQYISTRVAELSESKQYTPQLANHVKECLMEKSAGTYLWVSFTVKDLQTMEISEVEESLNQFPQGLDVLYERILQQIESTQRGLILNILRWCTFAVRPLSLNELATALEIKSTGLLDRVTILRGKLAYCGHFLSITKDAVTLVHHSASEAMPWFPLSNVELEQSKLASACISYFYDVYSQDKDAFLVETVEDDKRRKLRYPFFDYASRRWTQHFKHSGQLGAKILDEYPKFFSDESELLKLWMELANTICYAETTKEPGQAELAAEYGLTVLMKRALKKDGSTGSTPLQIAAAKGHVPILEMLLKNKVNINSRNSRGDTALCCAAENGHLSTVSVLLENGAHIDCEMTDGHTALSIARSVSTNRPEMVKLLLEWGAALHIACQTGDLLSIRMLLDPKWSLDVNRQDKNGNAALHWAAMTGDLLAVRLLFMKPGVDPNLLNRWGLSPFHLALFHRQLHVVEYLYMMRNWNMSPPEPNEKCRWDAIHLAIIGTHGGRPVQNMLQLLVAQLGVDPELRTHKAKDPDDEWHSHHFSELDGILTLYAGVTESIHPQDFCYETPLSLVIYMGWFDAVDYLLTDGNIDPNEPCLGCDGASPLHVAAQSLRHDIVRSLITRWGATVNCLDNHHRTPLHLVVSATVSHETLRSQNDQMASISETIQILLEAGAQTSVMDTNGRTPRDLFISNDDFFSQADALLII
ncbi:ankyrin repeat-containing domain protein [Trichoderma compactum]